MEVAQLLRHDFRLFVAQVFRSVSPGDKYLPNWHIDLICEHLQALQRDELGCNGLIVNIPPRYLKPVDEDALVLRGDGARVPLKEIEVGDHVVTHKGRPRKVVAVAKQGDLDTLRFEFHSGRHLTLAPDHPFLTPTGWTKAEDLSVGDVVGVPNLSLDLRSDQPDEAFRLAGYLVGDGCLAPIGDRGGFHCNLSCTDPDMVAESIRCAEVLGFTAKFRKTRVNLSRGARDWVRSIGMERTLSATKRVPAFVFSGSRLQIAEFLSGYMAADGTFARKGENRPFQYGCTTISSGLADDLLHLFLRLGVSARLRHRVIDTKYGGPNYQIWNVEISTMDGMAKLASMLRIPGRKGEKLNCPQLRRTDFTTDLYADKIVSIERAGKRPCRCLSVEEDSSFTANDVAVHNSICISVAWVAWLLGHKASEKLVCGSYAEDLAFEHSVNTRQVLEAGWYQAVFPRTKLMAGQKEKRQFKTTAKGSRQAVSVGSAVTGFGGNWLILDDPHNPKQAESDTQRKSTLEWIRTTWSTRLNDKKNGKQVLVMQRLHERDATGYLLAEEPEYWHHLCIPGIAEEKTIIDFGGIRVRRQVGDLIHPAREGKPEITRMKVKLGSYGFSGQYQQKPTPVGGGILKRAWWRLWPKDKAPECEFVFQSYDTAYTKAHLDKAESDQPDYSARTTWGVFKNPLCEDFDGNEGRVCMILIEAWRDRIEYFDLRKEAKRSYDEYEPDFLLIEEKSSGQALVSDLKRANLPIRTYRPKKYEDKMVRAHSIAPLMEAGTVWYMDRHWAEDVIDEVANFPKAAHDDWTDTLTQAVQLAKNNFTIEHPTDEPWEPTERNPARARTYG